MNNPNVQFAQHFVAALADAGLSHVCISPGSRSTPLTMAFAAHAGIRVTLHHDERSAAFFALGLGMALGKPAAVLCTSGTAAANYLPAIIEAHMSQIPLLVLTADRPSELRHSGANQTIDQRKIYGDHVLWSVDAPLPEREPPPLLLRHIESLASRLFHLANGIRKGAVHLNFPFRKPLQPFPGNAPIPDYAKGGVSANHAIGAPQLRREQIDEIAGIIAQTPRVLIICGPGCPGGDFPAAASDLANHLNCPILADPLSGLRFGSNAPIIGGYETFLANEQMPAWDEPQLILRFGAVPTSKWLNAYLAKIKPAFRLHIRASGVWADDAYQTTHFFQCDEAELCQILLKRLPANEDSGWLQSTMGIEADCQARLSQALAGIEFDGGYMADLVEGMPAGGRLFAGNSLPVRHLDQFGSPSRKPLRVYGNRGASGIDGVASSALGVAAGGASPMALAIGDVSLLHDLTGLLGVKHVSAPVTIVLFNNDGGGIFRRLPIAQFDPPFTELFLTPHGLDFAPLARGLEWAFVPASDREDFRRKFSQAINDPTPTIIEIKTDGEQDEIIRQQLVASLIN